MNWREIYCSKPNTKMKNKTKHKNKKQNQTQKTFFYEKNINIV